MQTVRYQSSVLYSESIDAVLIILWGPDYRILW